MTWLKENWVEVAIFATMLALFGFFVWAIVHIASQPSCEDLGGTIIQVGTREEQYVITRISFDDNFSIPIYGTRTVPVYDCVGER